MSIIAILIIVVYYLPIFFRVIKNFRLKKKNPNEFLMVLSDGNSSISQKAKAINDLSMIGYFGVDTIINKGSNYSDKKQVSIFCDSLDNCKIVNNLNNLGVEKNG